MNGDREIKNYIVSGADTCMNCGSSDHYHGRFEKIGASATLEVTCNSCQHEWIDEFTLTNVSQ